jgi:hypothetical protein
MIREIYQAFIFLSPRGAWRQEKLNNLRVITMVFDLLFRVGPAIKAIFELGYEPKEELFYELTAEQYSQLEKKGNDMSKKWFTIIPEDPKLDVPELLIVDEDGKKTFLDAANYIHRFCAREQPNRQFLSFDEKLEYAASQLPTVFSQSSKYGKINTAPHLTVVK